MRVVLCCQLLVPLAGRVAEKFVDGLVVRMEGRGDVAHPLARARKLAQEIGKVRPVGGRVQHVQLLELAREEQVRHVGIPPADEALRRPARPVPQPALLNLLQRPGEETRRLMMMMNEKGSLSVSTRKRMNEGKKN